MTDPDLNPSDIPVFDRGDYEPEHDDDSYEPLDFND